MPGDLSGGTGGNGAAPAPGDPIVVTSGYARLISRQDRRDYPMIAKPYRGEELAAKFRAVLAAPAPATPEDDEAVGDSALPVRRAACWVSRRRGRAAHVDGRHAGTAGLLCRRRPDRRRALELLSKGQAFDLLLTDLRLPGMSGEALAAEVHRQFRASGGDCQRLGRVGGPWRGHSFISSLTLPSILSRPWITRHAPPWLPDRHGNPSPSVR
jgi:hypothetical protein